MTLAFDKLKYVFPETIFSFLILIVFGQVLTACVPIYVKTNFLPYEYDDGKLSSRGCGNGLTRNSVSYKKGDITIVQSMDYSDGQIRFHVGIVIPKNNVVHLGKAEFKVFDKDQTKSYRRGFIVYGSDGTNNQDFVGNTRDVYFPISDTYHKIHSGKGGTANLTVDTTPATVSVQLPDFALNGKPLDLYPTVFKLQTYADWLVPMNC